jgi:uncharacterized hydrophobic protein (TIGR00271 family)
MKQALSLAFDLRSDQGDVQSIDAEIRKGARLGGTNMWVLMFAILIASIGLNVNSTAVIIGAMLISPLMGPIIAIGYGVGVYDFALIRRAFINLGVFVAISLLTSTLYFAVTPLSEAQSELLARTTPNLWDVLIAFFGGAAGMVALTRKNISPITPGVAIATALMPPLCTAGYGLANGNVPFVLGALFLFSINSVFIALATIVFAKLLKLPKFTQIDPGVHTRTHLITAIAVLVTVIPSVYLGYELVVRESFTRTTRQVLDEVKIKEHLVVLGQEVSADRSSIVITVTGDRPSEGLAQRIEARLAQEGIPTRITIRHTGSEKVDLISLKKTLREDLYQDTVGQLTHAQQQVAALTAENQHLKAAGRDRAQLVRELRAQYPNASAIAVTEGAEEASTTPPPLPAAPASLGGAPVELVVLDLPTALAAAERIRLENWLAIRLAGRKVRVLVQAPPVVLPPVAVASPPPARAARRKAR